MVISKGWTGVDPKQKLQVQTAIKSQNKGIKPHQAAKPVTAQQLAVVPKGNPNVHLPTRRGLGRKVALRQSKIRKATPRLKARQSPAASNSAAPGNPASTAVPGGKPHSKAPMTSLAPALSGSFRLALQRIRDPSPISAL